MSKECYTRYEVERQLWERWPRVLVVTEHSPQGTAQRRYVPESGEEIVRCRDCRNFVPKGTHVFSDGTVNDDFCYYIRSWMLQISSEGFCSWGERRDG